MDWRKKRLASRHNKEALKPHEMWKHDCPVTKTVIVLPKIAAGIYGKKKAYCPHCKKLFAFKKTSKLLNKDGTPVKKEKTIKNGSQES